MRYFAYNKNLQKDCMMQEKDSKRRRRPSYAAPLFFAGLEGLLIVIVFTILEGSVNIKEWGLLSYVFGAIWLFYTLYKTVRVLNREADLKR